MKRLAIAVTLLALAVPFGSARADELTGSNQILCSAGRVTVCCEDGACEEGTAAELNIPQFLEFDLVQKKVSTTKSSGLNRSSAIDNVKRTEGTIVLQGFEKGRAFSFVINEKTGALAAAVAAPFCGISAFGSCTPMPAAK